MHDSHRLVFFFQDVLWLVDSRTGEAKELYTVAPDQFGNSGSLALSPDNRTIYLVRNESGADVHLLTREVLARAP